MTTTLTAQLFSLLALTSAIGLAACAGESPVDDVVMIEGDGGKEDGIHGKMIEVEVHRVSPPNRTYLITDTINISATGIAKVEDAEDLFHVTADLVLLPTSAARYAVNIDPLLPEEPVRFFLYQYVGSAPYSTAQQVSSRGWPRPADWKMVSCKSSRMGSANYFSGFTIDRTASTFTTRGGAVYALADCGLAPSATVALFPLPTKYFTVEEGLQHNLPVAVVTGTCGGRECWR